MTEDPASDSQNDSSAPKTASPSQDRQQLIETAVRFLKNPKVIPTPVENKRMFLLKKGLTESEVNNAFKQVNIVEDKKLPTNENEIKQELENNKQSNEQNLQPVVANTNTKIIRQSSIWLRLVKWIRNFILAGCLTFTAYKLIAKKFLFKKTARLHSKWPKTLNENENLIDSIKEVKSSLNSLKESVESMSNMLKQLALLKQQQSSTINDEPVANGLRTEIQSIKSLLLSRNQFPSLPQVTPLLPSWQLAESPKEKSPALTSTSSSVSASKSDEKIVEEKSDEDTGNDSEANYVKLNASKNDLE